MLDFTLMKLPRSFLAVDLVILVGASRREGAAGLPHRPLAVREDATGWVRWVVVAGLLSTRRSEFCSEFQYLPPNKTCVCGFWLKNRQ